MHLRLPELMLAAFVVTSSTPAFSREEPNLAPHMKEYYTDEDRLERATVPKEPQKSYPRADFDGYHIDKDNSVRPDFYGDGGGLIYEHKFE